MHLEGKHTLPASSQQIWDALMNPEVLARTTPGLQKLVPKSEDDYDAVFEIKMGPVKGAFKGDMQIQDKKEPESFTLKMKVIGKQGHVAAQGKLNLKALEENLTEVEFAGDAKITGLLARTGQRVLTGVANTLTRQFFKALEDEFAPEEQPASGKKIIDRLKSGFKKAPAAPAATTPADNGLLAYFQKLFAYNHWANRETIEVMKNHGMQERPLKLMSHIIAAERLWMARLRQDGRQIVVWPDFDLGECETQASELQKEWTDYIDRTTPQLLAQRIEYTNSKGEPWSNTIHDILMHVIMHSAYHRGQIASSMRDAGLDPAYTDFIHAVRQQIVE